MGKQYKAILFDLDGTLIPMDNKVFEKGYFKSLCKKLAPYGIETEKLIAAVWAGTAGMAANDGSVINEDIFWEKFEKVSGVNPNMGVKADCDEFYKVEFKDAVQFTMENPMASEAVAEAHKAAPIVCLATNPIFPMSGQLTRLGWLGLTKDDFDLITACDTDYFCKPNPAYFISVCERLGVRPDECLLIGNDEGEDMYCGSAAGIRDCYLVTDTMIKNEDHPWEGPKGSFKEMLQMLRSLSE